MTHHVFITTSSTGVRQEHVVSNLDVFSAYSDYIQARFYNDNDFAPETSTTTHLPAECGSHGMYIISYLINCYAAYGEDTDAGIPDEYWLYQKSEILQSVVHTMQFLCISSKKAKVLFRYNEERTSYTTQDIVRDACHGTHSQRRCGQLLQSMIPHLNYRMIYWEKNTSEWIEEKTWVLYWRIRFALAIGWNVNLIIDGETMLHKYAAFFVDDKWIVPMGWQNPIFARPDHTMGDIVAHIIRLLIDEGSSLNLHSTKACLDYPSTMGRETGPTVVSTLACGNHERYGDIIHDLFVYLIEGDGDVENCPGDAKISSWMRGNLLTIRSQHVWECHGHVRQCTQIPFYFVLQERKAERLVAYMTSPLLSHIIKNLRSKKTDDQHEYFDTLEEAWHTPEYFQLVKQCFHLSSENALHDLSYAYTFKLTNAVDKNELWRFYSESFVRMLGAFVDLHRVLTPVKCINRDFFDIIDRKEKRDGDKTTLLEWLFERCDSSRSIQECLRYSDLLKKLLDVPGIDIKNKEHIVRSQNLEEYLANLLCRFFLLIN